MSRQNAKPLSRVSTRDKEPIPVRLANGQSTRTGSQPARDLFRHARAFQSENLSFVTHGYSARAILQLQRSRGNHFVQHIIAKNKVSKRISAPEPKLQKWESPEHVQLGDLAGGVATGLIQLECHNRDFPQRAGPMSAWPPEWQQLYRSGTPEQRRAITHGLTYGEMVALSGDLYRDFSALNLAPLREIYDLIPLIRGHATTSQFQRATGGRYLTLARENVTHFSTGPAGQRNIDVWRSMHTQAISAATQGDANRAWGLNAAADHFLTDAFSGGHIRTPRSRLMGSMPGDITSKVLHDLDNRFGIVVNNARGDGPWEAFGDDHLLDTRNTRNQRLAQEAVRLSQQDIANALAQRAAYSAPTVFEAERLVPYPVNPSTNRWGPLDLRQRMDELAREELPGIARETVMDDNDIREWVDHQSPAAISRQPPQELVRMVNVLLNGVVTMPDAFAIEKIYTSLPPGTTLNALRALIEPRISGLDDIGVRTRLRYVLSSHH